MPCSGCESQWHMRGRFCPPPSTHKTNRPQWRLTCVQMVGGDHQMPIISLSFSFILIRTSIILVHTFVCWNHIWLQSGVHRFMLCGRGGHCTHYLYLWARTCYYIIVYDWVTSTVYLFNKHTFQGKRIWFGLLKSMNSYYRTRIAQP